METNSRLGQLGFNNLDLNDQVGHGYISNKTIIQNCISGDMDHISSKVAKEILPFHKLVRVVLFPIRLDTRQYYV